MIKNLIHKSIEDANLVLKKIEKTKYIFLISKIIELCQMTIIKKGKIIFCGNGGSASDSLHLVAELIGRFKKNRKAISAISLNSEISTITAIANDFGYEKIFERQLESIGNINDILIAISTSGKSKNIIKALTKAKKMKIKTILLTSERFTNKKKIADLLLKVPTDEVARAQEIHLLIGHLICEQLENFIKKN
jgi:D-sedoheptulose 7-phosphate isomerase